MKKIAAITIVALALVSTILAGCTKGQPLLPPSTDLNEVMYVKVSAHPEKPLFHQGEKINYVFLEMRLDRNSSKL